MILTFTRQEAASMAASDARGVGVLPVDGDVVAQLRPNSRGARRKRLPHVGDARQGRPVDFDQLGRVLRLLSRARDDHGYAFPDETHASAGEDRAQGLPHGGAGKVGQFDLAGHVRHASGVEVGAGEDGLYAGGGAGRLKVYGQDFGVGVGRAQEGGPELALDIDVVREAAPPLKQARVFLASQRLAYSELSHPPPARHFRARGGWPPRV